MTNIFEIIASRRSTKPETFTGKRISDEDLRVILEAANWAPTHGYTEPWRFVVHSGEGLVRLGNFLAQNDQPNSEADDFNAVRYERLAQRPTTASHVLGIAVRLGANPKIPAIEEVCATAMAVQNMWLAATALGISAYWGTGAVAFSEDLRNFFELDDQHEPLGLFYLGYSEEEKAGRRLSPIDDKLRWNQ